MIRAAVLAIALVATPTLVASALVASALATSALAQHAGHGGPATAPEPASTREFRDANATMHKAMDIPFTGRPDRDFIASMIPHHEGAVAMARVVLRHGTDAEVKKLAQEVIDTQGREIAWMREWLARNP